MRLLALFFFIVTVSTHSCVSQNTSSIEHPVAGWYFKAISRYPGGITFRPVVLFKDSSYFNVDEDPIEDLNISKSKIEDKSRWGKWKRNNDLFTLTDSEKKVKVYDLRKGNWFPAFPFDISISLKGKYKKVSGGVYNNGMLAMFQSEIVFLDDVHFTNSEDGGVSAYSSNSWKMSKDSGTYKIHDNTIELHYNQGEKVRLSFAIGTEGYDTIDTNMIFIGGKAYIRE